MNVLRQNTLLSKLYTSNDEWQGSHPCRFKPEGIKILPKLLHEHHPDGERKHYYGNKETTNDPSYKPGRKIFNERYSPEPEKAKKSGIKKIVPVYGEPKVYNSHRVSNPFTIRQEPVRNLVQFPSKWVNSSNEYEIDWDNKKRIPNIISMRNGMEVISPGEKLYKNVDYSPDFYSNEGWVVGSSNTINYKKFSNEKKGFYSSMEFSQRLLGDIYNVKEQKFMGDYDKQYVSNNLHKFDSMLNNK
jgi:hypothetical protein